MIIPLNNHNNKIERQYREYLSEDLCGGVDCGLFGLAFSGTLADKPDTFE